MIAAAKPEAESEDIAGLERTGLRKMLSEAEVLAIIPVSSVTLWRMVRKGTFPKPTFISPNKKVWFADEVVRWQSEINGRGRGRGSRNHPARTRSNVK
jgi:predicted DNA-binding transcriptional regulator AlpA